MTTKTLYTCPCCGYMTLDAKPPGTYLVCPICFWEDDAPDEVAYSPGATLFRYLRQAQQNFIQFGACDHEWLECVRAPSDADIRSPDWQLIALSPTENERLALIEKITDAFDQVSLEDGITLQGARSLDDWCSLEEAKKIGQEIDQRRWQDVPDAELEKFWDVFGFLDAKGFKYYVPANMIWCLKNYKTSVSASLQTTIDVLRNI